MSFHTQPVLIHEKVALYPLMENDFDRLYLVASDPEIWEQHPNNDRWKKSVFQTFFDEAIRSRGALKIVEPASGAVIGSTRIYDYNEAEHSVVVGYTFIAKDFWGKGINPLVKELLLDYLFQFVNTVYFYVGAQNLRSQIAVARIGAKKVGETSAAQPDGSSRVSFVYAISRADWFGRP